MWQRFTEHARKAVFYAQEEAERARHPAVDNVHLLLGLLREKTRALWMLDQAEVNIALLRDRCGKEFPNGDVSPKDMTLTPAAKRTIDWAYDTARSLQDGYIGTEHLLLALSRNEMGPVKDILAKHNATYERLLEILATVQREPTTPSPPSRNIKQGPITMDYLTGACLQEHLILSMIADSDALAGKLIRAQVSDVMSLQHQLLNQIQSQARLAAAPTYPNLMQTLIAAATVHASGKPVEPHHLLVAILESQSGYSLDGILRGAGLTPQRTLALMKEAAS